MEEVEITEIEGKQIIELGELLCEHNVEQETALTISLMIQQEKKRLKMIAWLKENPKVTIKEICEKARTLKGEQDM